MSEAHVGDDRIGEFVDGSLSAAAAAQLVEHLSTCGRCRARAERLRSARLVLAAMPHELAPSRDLWPEMASEMHRRSRGREVRRWALRAVAATTFFFAGSAWPYAGFRAPPVSDPTAITLPQSAESRLLSLQSEAGAFASRLSSMAGDSTLDQEARQAAGEIALGAILTAASELQPLLPRGTTVTPLVTDIADVRGNLRPSAPMLNVVSF